MLWWMNKPDTNKILLDLNYVESKIRFIEAESKVVIPRSKAAQGE
jgi:hypothetical protein